MDADLAIYVSFSDGCMWPWLAICPCLQVFQNPCALNEGACYISIQVNYYVYLSEDGRVHVACVKMGVHVYAVVCVNVSSACSSTHFTDSKVAMWCLKISAIN